MSNITSANNDNDLAIVLISNKFIISLLKFKSENNFSSKSVIIEIFKESHSGNLRTSSAALKNQRERREREDHINTSIPHK